MYTLGFDFKKKIVKKDKIYFNDLYGFESVNVRSKKKNF